MVLIERFCYNLGTVLADVVYFSAVPTGAAVAGRIAASSKFVGQLATKHVLLDKSAAGITKNVLLDKSAAGITKNVFECLEYID